MGSPPLRLPSESYSATSARVNAANWLLLFFRNQSPGLQCHAGGEGELCCREGRGRESTKQTPKKSPTEAPGATRAEEAGKGAAPATPPALKRAAGWTTPTPTKVIRQLEQDSLRSSSQKIASLWGHGSNKKAYAKYHHNIRKRGGWPHLQLLE